MEQAEAKGEKWMREEEEKAIQFERVLPLGGDVLTEDSIYLFSFLYT